MNTSVRTMLATALLALTLPLAAHAQDSFPTKPMG